MKRKNEDECMGDYDYDGGERWYPVTYFRLSFGKSESLYEAIWTLQKEFNIPINISIRDLTDLLHELVQRTDVRKRLNFPAN